MARLRRICLGLPETFEKEAWGQATFRVTDGQMFALCDCDHHGSGHTSVWVKAPPLAQEHWVDKDPARYFVPPYMGPKGWVGVRLEAKGVRPDWKELEKILAVGHELSRPKRKSGSKKISKKKATPAAANKPARPKKVAAKKESKAKQQRP